MQTYYGIDLNESGDPLPWSDKELTVFQKIIDLLGQAVDYPSVGAAGNPREYDMIFGVKADGSLASIGLGMADTDEPRCPLDIVLDDSTYAGALSAGTGLCVENDDSAIIQLLTSATGAGAVYFGTSADIDEAYISYNANTNLMAISSNSGAGVGLMSISALGIRIGSIAAATAALHVEGTGYQAYLYQSSAVGLAEPLQVRQADLDVGFIHFRGSDSDGGHLMATAQGGAPVGQDGWVQIYITNDNGGSGNIPTGIYWFPVYQ